jgi:hypothetical protein
MEHGYTSDWETATVLTELRYGGSVEGWTFFEISKQINWWNWLREREVELILPPLRQTGTNIR